LINKNQASNKWYVLILSTLTVGLGFGLPTMCMPVLFKEIAAEFGLTLVEVGIVWGTISFSGIIACLIGGVLGDRFGLKNIVTISCFLSAISGALRGLSGDFVTLVVTSFFFSLLSSVVMINIPKVAKIWFPQRQFGLANGTQATGMSIGFTIGAMFSATVFSPWLDGWRNVLFLYGLVTAVLGLCWLFTVREAPGEGPTGTAAPPPSMGQSILYVFRLRSVWLLGFGLSGYLGCLQGITGYLPLYLQGIGWSPAGADGALAVFNIAGCTGAIPIALLSDRLGLRKAVLMALVIIAAAGTALLPLSNGELIWVLAFLVGFTRDAAMMLFIVMVMELKEIDVLHAATAIGLLQTLSRIGGSASPPLGNGLADTGSGAPYFFWAALGVAGLVILGFVRDTGHKARAA
jgi:MFS family permease